MLTSPLDAYILRYRNLCANDDNSDTTDYFSPCACMRGNNKPSHWYMYMAHHIVANQAVADHHVY